MSHAILRALRMRLNWRFIRDIHVALLHHLILLSASCSSATGAIRSLSALPQLLLPLPLPHFFALIICNFLGSFRVRIVTLRHFDIGVS